MRPAAHALTLAVALAAGCYGGQEASWTVAEAESISAVRGLRVRVEHCQGLGTAEGKGASARYRRFMCVAGGRNPSDPVDTVAVLYELKPLEAYDGPASKHALENVRFVGGPGIP
jgi:hypothetical protein